MMTGQRPRRWRCAAAGAGCCIHPQLLQGAWQMALDRWLLDAVAADGSAVVLRFYGWPWPVLSLGRHQRRYPTHWDAMARAGALDLVRRPSGGTAVLHWGGLTYALVIPRRLLPRGAGADSYRFCCRWLQQGCAACGMPLVFGDRAASLGGSYCFSRSTAADLVDADGDHKRIGNAQLRGTHAVLQHGEILKQQLVAALTRQLGITRQHCWQPAAADWGAMAATMANRPECALPWAS